MRKPRVSRRDPAGRDVVVGAGLAGLAAALPGEHTAGRSRFGTMQGAIRSGERAAGDLLELLR
jgi:monoamine oxidase